MSDACKKKAEMSDGQLLEGSFQPFKEGEMAGPVPASYFLKHWREFMCGGGAAFCNILISYPLNKLIFRQVRLFIMIPTGINSN